MSSQDPSDSRNPRQDFFGTEAGLLLFEAAGGFLSQPQLLTPFRLAQDPMEVHLLVYPNSFQTILRATHCALNEEGPLWPIERILRYRDSDRVCVLQLEQTEERVRRFGQVGMKILREGMLLED